MTATAMGVKDIYFNGVIVARVTVIDARYAEARNVIGAAATAPAERERVATTKLRELGFPCAAATNAAHDVRVTVGGAMYEADIKTLYRTYGVADDNSQAAQIDIWGIIDHAYDKEVGQGTTALFDLSYLNTNLRDGAIGGIHNTYPKAMTLWYTFDGRDIHFHYPHGRIEVHQHV